MFIAEVANFFVAILRTVQPEFCCRNIHNEDNESHASQQIIPNDADEGDEMFYKDEPFLSTNIESNFNRREEMQQSRCKSFGESLKTSFAILVASVVPLALFTIILLYGNLNSSNLCFESEHLNDSRQLTSAKKYILIGESIGDVLLSLLFPASTLLLFGNQELRRNIC